MAPCLWCALALCPSPLFVVSSLLACCLPSVLAQLPWVHCWMGALLSLGCTALSALLQRHERYCQFNRANFLCAECGARFDKEEKLDAHNCVRPTGIKRRPAKVGLPARSC